MFENYFYYPDLKVSPSEIEALERLPGPDKDILLPIIRLRRWTTAKKFESIIKQIDRAIGSDRPCIVDIFPPEKESCEAEEELGRLLSPDDGYSHWVEFVGKQARLVPVLQTQGGNKAQIIAEANSLLSYDRGLVVRLRRETAWNINVLNWLGEIDFAGSEFLIVFDYGQIAFGTDVTVVSATLAGLANLCINTMPSADLYFTIAASSFPSNFAEIHRETYRLDILERQLFKSLAGRMSGIAKVRYGDYASVFAGERGFARGGAPRIDLPKQTRWIYHRKEEGGFQSAASAVIQDKDWDEDLVIWGTERIRDAAAGKLEGLTYPRAWTAVRIHLHLHQQVHFGGSSGELNDTDEEWKD